MAICFVVDRHSLLFVSVTGHLPGKIKKCIFVLKTMVTLN